MIDSYYEGGLIETRGHFCGAQRVAALDHAVLSMSKIEQHLLDRFGGEKIWENEMRRSDALTEDIASKCEADVQFDPRIFLSKAGNARTISHYRANEVIYSQGDPAEDRKSVV